MNAIAINKHKDFVEVIQGDKVFHLGERPWITRNQADFGIYLIGFDFTIYLPCQVEMLINNTAAPGSIDEIIDLLFKQVFN
jgi:hypothetical protein